MATTVHVPKHLRARVDVRAKNEEWPTELVRMLEEPMDPKAARELERSMNVVRARRTRGRKAPALWAAASGGRR
jgi:hypothetical protein